MRQRYKDHSSQLFATTDKIGWLRCDVQELLFLESWFIAILRPFMNGNSNRRAPRAVTTKSAKLNVSPVDVWQCGRSAEARFSRCCEKVRCGVIEAVNEDLVNISGEWYPRTCVSVLLP
jgi:hypothetical protein